MKNLFSKSKKTQKENSSYFNFAKNKTHLEDIWKERTNFLANQRVLWYFQFSLVFLDEYNQWKPYKIKQNSETQLKKEKDLKQNSQILLEENEIPKEVTTETVRILNLFFKFLSEQVLPILENPNQAKSTLSNGFASDILPDIQNGISLQMVALLARSSVHRQILFLYNAHTIILKLFTLALKIFSHSIEFIDSNIKFTQTFNFSIFLLSNILKFIYLFEKYETQKNSKFKIWIDDTVIQKLTEQLEFFQQLNQRFILTPNIYQIQKKILSFIQSFIIQKSLPSKSQDQIISYCLESLKPQNIYLPLLTSVLDANFQNDENGFICLFEIIMNLLGKNNEEKNESKKKDQQNIETKKSPDFNFNIFQFKIRIRIFRIFHSLISKNQMLLTNIMSKENVLCITDFILWSFYSFVGINQNQKPK
ncbi:hypothetical protein M0811_10150 [Anaeramoeba ignava]|uniref:Uncharacterized protein n=1 Tax=Anaeramoeba ignava TaxID=1746090 RepID=A0A9Q0R9K9_ANAIG|nr:hypothetical protein M0811_10150 [Anaeramoeba ignava]